MADKITTVRIILAPVFFIVCNADKLISSGSKGSLGGSWPYWQIPILWIILGVAQLSDMLDGIAARKRGEVSDFGKFYDPFADTIIQITVFYCFVWNQILPMVPYLLVLYREFGILFVRNLMQKKGISMGARIGGKIKTIAYIFAGFLALAVFSLQNLLPLFLTAGRISLYALSYSILSKTTVVVFWAAVCLSLLSFADYVKEYIKNTNIPH